MIARRRYAVLVPALAVAAALPVVATAPALGAGWSAAEVVMTGPAASPDGIWQRGHPPRLASTSAGVIVVWAAGTTVRARERVDGRWSAVRALGPWSENYDDSSPALATARGRALVAWSGFNDDAHNPRSFLRVVEWPGGGRAPVRLTPPGTGAGFAPRVGLSAAGEELILWAEPGARVPPGAPPSPGTHQSWATRDTGRWTTPRPLFPDFDGGDDLSLATAASGAAVAVTRGEVRASLRAPGRAFQPGRLVLPTFGNATAALRPDGRAAVVASSVSFDSGGDSWSLVSASATSDGGWAAPLEIARTALPARMTYGRPGVAVRTDGRLVAAWREIDPLRQRALVAGERTPGGSWGRPLPLGPASRPVGVPVVAAGPGRDVTVAWSQGGRILVRGIGPDGRLRPASQVSGGRRGCATPGLAVRPDGTTVVAFTCGLRGPLLAAVRRAG